MAASATKKLWSTRPLSWDNLIRHPLKLSIGDRERGRERERERQTERVFLLPFCCCLVYLKFVLVRVDIDFVSSSSRIRSWALKGAREGKILSDFSATKNYLWAVVVGQLVEWSLPTNEVSSSPPVIGKLFCRTFVYCQLYWKDENKEKEAGNSPFFK